MGKVRVAIIGVGNCASALVQGVQFYRDVADDAVVPGLMHPVQYTDDEARQMVEEFVQGQADRIEGVPPEGNA